MTARSQYQLWILELGQRVARQLAFAQGVKSIGVAIALARKKEQAK